MGKDPENDVISCLPEEMAAFKPLILVSFIATCAAFNPLSLSGSVVDHVAHEQLLNVITLEGPASSSSRHRSTRSASTHAVNSSTFTLSGDKHRYGNVFYSGSGSPVSKPISGEGIVPAKFAPYFKCKHTAHVRALIHMRTRTVRVLWHYRPYLRLYLGLCATVVEFSVP